MAEELVMNVKSNIKSVTKETDDLGKSIGKASDETKDLDKGLEETGKSGSKGFRAIGTAVKGFGMALKAAGIGLVIALFVTLKEALERNQKVMDAVNTIMSAVSITFNQVADVLVDVYEWVTKSSDRFDGLKKVMTSLMTIALVPIKLLFYEMKLAIQAVQFAWAKWKKDTDTMAELKGEMQETVESIKEIGLAAIDAAKDIGANIGDAIGEIWAMGEMAIEGISKISIKSNYDLAKATTAAVNSSKLAEAAIQGLIEKNDLLAETQRQIRDDERKTFAERIAANVELGEILKKQKIEMMKLADSRVAAAKLEKDANEDNIDLQVAYQQALNDRAGVEAQIAGFKSEQLTNEASLQKELLETEKELRASALEGIALELQELENSYEMQLEMARKAGEDTLAITEKYEKDKQAILDAAAQEALDKAIKAEKAVADAKKAIRDANMANIEAGIGVAKELAGENKEIQAALLIAENAAGIAKILINTAAANAKAVATSPITAGMPWVAINSVSAGLGIASSIAATAKGLSALGESGGGGGGASAATPSASAQTPAPQMMSGAFEMTGVVEPEPLRAFVVTDEMTSSQNQLANIRRRATI